MNILETRVVLRDRAFLDVVDLAVRFFIHHGRAFAKLGAIVLLPAYVVTWGVAAIAGWGWGWVAALVLSPFAAAPFTVLASKLLFESEARTYDVLASTASAMPRLIGARLLEGLALVLAAGCLIAPTAWVLALCFYTNEIFALERAPIAAGIARAQRLLWGQSGYVILGMFFLRLLKFPIVILGDFVGRSILEDLLQLPAPPSMFHTGGSGFALAAFWLYLSFDATCRFFLYINARTRTEGWDVQTRFAAIAARASEDKGAERASLLPGRAA
jgi:hypothetical protein